MLKNFDLIKLSDPDLPYAVKGFITKFRIAQLLAETGPLSDFETINQ